MAIDIKELENFLNSRFSDVQESLVIGYANIKELLIGDLSDYKYCIVIGKKLDSTIIDTVKNGPTFEYLELYNRVNAELNQIGLELSGYLHSKKIPNKLIKPTGISKDVKNYNPRTLTYYFSHKMAATRAGLGWIGKTDLMVTKKFGPRVRFVSVLLKDHIQKNGIPIEKIVVPIIKSSCGSCSICIELCPAKAGNGKEWDINTDRDSFFNAYSCMEKCRELSFKNLGKNETICGICVEACPIGK
ncbi:MAG: 4Fe-4S double cluster binding domain-containing protein [Actinomycetota bacterium]